MTKIIKGMITIGKDHWIQGFVLDDKSHVDYAEVANKPKDYVILDEQDNTLSLETKKDSVFMKRDKIELTKLQGNVQMDEYWDAQR